MKKTAPIELTQKISLKQPLQFNEDNILYITFNKQVSDDFKSDLIRNICIKFNNGVPTIYVENSGTLDVRFEKETPYTDFWK